MSISFEVFAKETTYNCERNKDSPIFEYKTLKVDDPFFGERKLFIRKEGGWEQLCTEYGDVITDDSFKCFRPESPEDTSYPKRKFSSSDVYPDYFIFDEVIPRFFQTFSNYNYNYKDQDYTCTKSE